MRKNVVIFLSGVLLLTTSLALGQSETQNTQPQTPNAPPSPSQPPQPSTQNQAPQPAASAAIPPATQPTPPVSGATPTVKAQVAPTPQVPLPGGEAPSASSAATKGQPTVTPMRSKAKTQGFPLKKKSVKPLQKK